jgi:hypothetical protein
MENNNGKQTNKSVFVRNVRIMINASEFNISFLNKYPGGCWLNFAKDYIKLISYEISWGGR